MISSGQIIARSHDLGPKNAALISGKSPYYNNPGWENRMIIWPDNKKKHVMFTIFSPIPLGYVRLIVRIPVM